MSTSWRLRVIKFWFTTCAVGTFDMCCVVNIRTIGVDYVQLYSRQRCSLKKHLRNFNSLSSKIFRPSNVSR